VTAGQPGHHVELRFNSILPPSAPVSGSGISLDMVRDGILGNLKLEEIAPAISAMWTNHPTRPAITAWQHARHLPRISPPHLPARRSVGRPGRRPPPPRCDACVGERVGGWPKAWAARQERRERRLTSGEQMQTCVFCWPFGTWRDANEGSMLSSSKSWSGYDVENRLCASGFKIFPASYRDRQFQRVEGMLSTAQYICKGRG
jgi:hypothetical protein